MRRVILIMNALAVLLVVTGIARTALGKIRSDAAGQGMAMAYVIIGSVIALIFTGISFALADNGRLIWVSIVLAVVGGFFALVAAVSSQ